MASPAKQFPEDNFVHIGRDCYFSRGSEGKVSLASNESSPNIILVFGWMGAKLPHLHKYTKIYEDLYPEATKILIRSEPRFFIRSQATNESRLAAVIDVLEALDCVSRSSKANGHQNGNGNANGHISSTPRILVHAFSNGGSYQLVTLGQALNKKFPQRTLTSAIVLDSSPGGGDLASTKRAFIGHIRNPILYFISSLIVTALYIIGTVYLFVFEQPNRVEVLKEALNHPHVLPWVNQQTRRLYIYSKMDELIPWEQVEQQVEDSRNLGYPTKTEMFTDTPHVNHAKGDPAKYWSAIGKLWSEAKDA